MRNYESMGNELTTALGLEDRKVILYWKAFDEKRFLACSLLYDSWKIKRKA